MGCRTTRGVAVVAGTRKGHSSSSRHPGELELSHYLRGTLASDHAALILAHSALCSSCSERLEQLAGATLAGDFGVVSGRRDRASGAEEP